MGAQAAVAAQSEEVAYRINCGQNKKSLADPDGVGEWQKDTGFAKGESRPWREPYLANTPFVRWDGTQSHKQLHPVYASQRYASDDSAALRYSLAVEQRPFVVRLHFAEIYGRLRNAGDRVFDVALEGVTVMSRLDIFAEVGWGEPLVKCFTVPQVVDGQLDLHLNRVKQNPTINGIEVIYGASCPKEEEVTAPPNLCDNELRYAFFCHHDFRRCIPWDYQCDGSRDCTDGSDENGCVDGIAASPSTTSTTSGTSSTTTVSTITVSTTTVSTTTVSATTVSATTVSATTVSTSTVSTSTVTTVTSTSRISTLVTIFPVTNMSGTNAAEHIHAAPATSSIRTGSGASDPPAQVGGHFGNGTKFQARSAQADMEAPLSPINKGLVGLAVAMALSIVAFVIVKRRSHNNTKHNFDGVQDTGFWLAGDINDAGPAWDPIGSPLPIKRPGRAGSVSRMGESLPWRAGDDFSHFNGGGGSGAVRIAQLISRASQGFIDFQNSGGLDNADVATEESYSDAGSAADVPIHAIGATSPAEKPPWSPVRFELVHPSTQMSMIDMSKLIPDSRLGGDFAALLDETDTISSSIPESSITNESQIRADGAGLVSAESATVDANDQQDAGGETCRLDVQGNDEFSIGV